MTNDVKSKLSPFEMLSKDDVETIHATATKVLEEIGFKIHNDEALEILKAMAETGNPNSVSDAGVGALAIRSAVMGAFLNVKINAGNLVDKPFIQKILKEGKKLEDSVCRKEAEILKTVESRL